MARSVRPCRINSPCVLLLSFAHTELLRCESGHGKQLGTVKPIIYGHCFGRPLGFSEEYDGKSRVTFWIKSKELNKRWAS